jgi:polar amino acid transport system substrate-binding protein
MKFKTSMRLSKIYSSLLFVLILSFLLSGCGKESKPFRIGIDPNWYPLNFYGQEGAVNGFVEDLLLEIAFSSGLEFKRVQANWDSLLEGMTRDRYDAVFASLPPYPMNRVKYEFSMNFLDVGPVLIVPVDSASKGLKEMTDAFVGALSNTEGALVLQGFPNVVSQNYARVTDLLDAVASGQLQGAVLDRLLAVNYVRDLYAGKLKVIPAPLNDQGLHLIVPKGEKPDQVALFEKSLKSLIKKHKVDALLKKWSLN